MFSKVKKAPVIDKSAKNRKLKEYMIGYLFAAPVILGIIIYTYVPAVQSFVYSFFNYDGFYTMNYVGLNNFKVLLTIDPDFWTVVKNTFIYAVCVVPLSLIVGYLVALTVNNSMKGITVYRMLFYLPVIIPGVASGLLWLDLFEAGPTGIFNKLLEAVNLPRLAFFSKQETSMATLIATTLWGVGGGMVIWLAAFKNIPVSLYESAKIDGANAFMRTIQITIPLSTPMIFYNLVTGIIGALQVSSTMIIGGSSGKGVGDSLYFIAVKIYHDSFGGAFRLGYSSAFAWMLFAVIGLLTFIVFKTSKWVYYED